MPSASTVSVTPVFVLSWGYANFCTLPNSAFKWSKTPGGINHRKIPWCHAQPKFEDMLFHNIYTDGPCTWINGVLHLNWSPYIEERTAKRELSACRVHHTTKGCKVQYFIPCNSKPGDMARGSIHHVWTIPGRADCACAQLTDYYFTTSWLTRPLTRFLNWVYYTIKLTERKHRLRLKFSAKWGIKQVVLLKLCLHLNAPIAFFFFFLTTR